MHRLLPFLAFSLLALCWRSAPERVAALAPEREIASLLPPRCRIYLEGSGLEPVLARGLEHPLVRDLAGSALGAAALRALPHTPEDALARAAEWLGAPVLPLAADLVRRGVAVGVDPATKGAVLVALGSEPARVAEHLVRVLRALERQAGWPGALEQPMQRWSGADVWVFDGKAFLARREALLVLGNESALVEEVLDLAADPAGRGLLASPGFEARRAAAPPATLLWSWLDLAQIEPLGDDGFRELRAGSRSPAVQGLLGAEIGGLLGARALSAAIVHRAGSAAGSTLELQLHACDSARVAALAPAARAADVPAGLGGENLGEALLYRDYARYFTERAQLFAPEQLAAFAEATTNGALFFEGRDLGEEVLAQLSPWIRLIAREVEFPAERVPELPLPALAVVGVLADEREGERWVAAFQSLLAVINVDQAQEGGKSLRLFLAREGDVDISAARYATPRPGEGVDFSYNFEPALAVVGRHLVLTTHTALARQLVRELRGAAPGAPSGARESLELQAPRWRGVLQRNFEFLVANEMLKKGLTREQAVESIEGLRLALESLERVRVNLGRGEDGDSQLLVEVRLTAGAR